MSLASGTALGAYEIVGLLGVGGMGEVYRARDGRLGRSVAIKVISEAFLSDGDRIARFEREAKVLASLNHPHIAALHGMEESAGRHFLVMELVEGETLAERLHRGTMPVREALDIARQIADALEAAHETGVVHRDLKPGNVKITPDDRVKVLDFGLAKVIDPSSAAASSSSPTLSMRGTELGVILGTAGYMSPEQAKGLPADHRSDIFSLGVVLYEMLAGRRLFLGETVADVLASVLVREPDLGALRPTLNPRLRELLRRCLEKQPKRRWQAIGDVRAEIEMILAAPEESTAAAWRGGVPVPLWRRAMPLIGAAVVAGILTGVVVWRLRPATDRPAVVRFAVTLPQIQQLALARQAVAISPDGAHFAYASNGRLFVRSLSEQQATPIGSDTTPLAFSPAFSPDSQSIAFWSADGTIKRTGIAGGPALTICTQAFNPLGLSWGPDGIVFALPGQILRVAISGGTPEVLVRVNPGERVESPQMLPGGKAVLFTLATAGPSPETWDGAAIVVQSLGTGERKTVVAGGADGRYSPTGHIVYAVGGTLLAAPFDLRRLQSSGVPVPVVEGVKRSPAGASATAQFGFSDNGSLIYIPGPPGSLAYAAFDIKITDRAGAMQSLHLPQGRYEYPRVSPDGKHIAFDTSDGQEAIVWTYALDGSSGIHRLTFGANNRFPVWSGDGERIAFQSDREGDAAIFWQPADGTGPAERLTTPDAGSAHIPDAWSPSSDELAFTVVNGSSFSLWTYSPRAHKAAPFDGVKSPVRPTAVFSPDGKWLAYTSSASSTNDTQVSVQPVPPTGARYQVFAKAGDNPHHPAWSTDGKQLELLYVPRPGGFEAVSVVTRPTFAFGNPVTVPRAFPVASPNMPRAFDVMPNGKIVSVAVAGEAATAETSTLPTQVYVVLNWFDELTTRVKAGK
jgi:Tol biopolymer transport system component